MACSLCRVPNDLCLKHFIIQNDPLPLNVSQTPMSIKYNTAEMADYLSKIRHTTSL